MNKASGKIKVFSSMAVFGTIGLFVRCIPLPSAFIAMIRGLVGALFIFLVLKAGKRRLDTAAIKKNALILLLTGIVIGFNWILLFEAYRYTTVATATLCYYFAPIFVLLVSPFLLGEKLSARKLVCVIAALIGMVFVSGVLQTGFSGGREYTGVLFGLGAAVLYASIVILNKKVTGLEAFDITLTELAVAGVVLIPYVLLTQEVTLSGLGTRAWICLAVVCIVHTGICYTLYFSGLRETSAQSASMLSYIDPIVAIICSALILKEPMGVYGILGAVLVLGATFISELPEKKKM